jgi:hypothetical protein
MSPGVLGRGSGKTSGLLAIVVVVVARRHMCHEQERVRQCGAGGGYDPDSRLERADPRQCAGQQQQEDEEVPAGET